jgi:ribosome recycling factor
MAEDVRTLRISPWDMNIAKEIEKAITEANLGVSVSTDDKGLEFLSLSFLEKGENLS